ncbi:type II toxin-antitoxin system prevent-host-death family antitoxin [Streptomyces sp. 549]|uniref:type II toxin-antitoxin system prevent-host-death family antitoxin n=1 Tax=Streptomyces sp. 549 TaxID=3049076 RepID=UPI0032E35DAD
MSITARDARRALLPLIRTVNDDHEAIEIVSGHGTAVPVSADAYARWCSMRLCGNRTKSRRHVARRRVQ